MIKHDRDLTGLYVVLHDEALAAQFRTPEFRVVQVTGGFGAMPNAIGRALYVRFHDNDEMVTGIQFVDRYATHAEIHRFAHLAGSATCLLGDDCPSLEA